MALRTERQSARMSKNKTGGMAKSKALTGSAVKGLMLRVCTRVHIDTAECRY